jgi:putative transposase
VRKNNRKLYGYQTTNRTKHNLKVQEFLHKHFWKEKTFWTNGYFICSLGEATPKTIRNYIKNQG